MTCVKPVLGQALAGGGCAGRLAVVMRPGVGESSEPSEAHRPGPTPVWATMHKTDDLSRDHTQMITVLQERLAEAVDLITQANQATGM